MSRERKDLAEVYLHVGNSGTTFGVSDHYGPTVTIRSSSFGNLNHKFEFSTTKKGLEEMRDVINKALEHEFSEDYCCAAKPPGPRAGFDCCTEDVGLPGDCCQS